MNPPDSPSTPVLTLYGAVWCEDTRRTCRLLRRLGVPHDYRDVDEDLEAMDEAIHLNMGVRRTPVVRVADDVLVEPSNAALATALIKHGVLTRQIVAERLHLQNVGDFERGLRVFAGLMLLALQRQAPRALRGSLSLAAGGLLLTGVAGWCPVFQARRVTSLHGPADRPDEAERRTWLTTVDREHLG